MNLTSVGVMSASLVIGVAAAVTIFDAATGLGSESTSVQSPISVKEDRRGSNRRSPRFAPCEKPAKLVDGACVTDVTRTVVVPPAAAPRSAPQAAPQAAPVPAAPQDRPAPVRSRDDDHHDDDHDEYDDDRDDDDRDDDRDDDHDDDDRDDDRDDDDDDDRDDDD